MSDKIKNLNERKRSLLERINHAERHKKEVHYKVQKLALRLKEREISYSEYEENIRRVFGERSPEKWIKYYDSYIADCFKLLDECNKEILIEKGKRIAILAVPLLFFVLILLIFKGSIDKAITGLTVESSTEIFSDSLDKSFHANEDYDFIVEQNGKLNWVKLSGEIKGEGNVKVYLLGEGKEFLVLDSEDLEFEEVALTGGVITGFNTEGSESGISENAGSEESDAEVSTNSEIEEEIVGTESEQESVNGDENIGEESLDESGSQAEGEILESEAQIEEASGENAEDFTANEGSSNESANEIPDENATNEQIGENNESANEIPDENATNEQIGENNESEISDQNVSDGQKDKEKDVKEEKAKKKKFADYCQDTCDLSLEGLNELSYVLRVEVKDGTELKIDKIEYEIEFTEEDADNISGQNLTEILPEINATNATIPELNLTNITSPPVLVRNFSDIEIAVNNSYILLLDDYFKNTEGYDISDAENITFKLENGSLEIVPDLNFIGNRSVRINARNVFGETEGNEFVIYVLEILQNATANITSNIATLQYKAVINRPVKWLKYINSTEGLDNLKIELPEDAENITIKRGGEARRALEEVEEYEEEVENSDRGELVKGLTGQAISEDGKKGFLTRLWEWITGIGITGNVVQEDNETIIESSEGIVVDLELLNDSGEEIAIEYETEGPIAIEENLSNGKRLVVSGKDELNLTDILAFAEIPEIYKIDEKNKIKIFWRENESFVEFNALDLDENGLLDYVEWVVPHLSNQTYDIILVIKAEHLDENRTFISDIYNEVRKLDGNWSEEIKDAEYVRVTFEIPLDNTRDITVFPRVVNGTPRIEIYEFNKTEMIAEFSSLNENEYNKVFLVNLNGSQDTFDLRVMEGSVEFDHIIDPTGSTPEASLTFPANASLVLRKDLMLNSSVKNSDGKNMSVYFYMIGSANTADFYKHGLVYQTFGVTNNTNLTFANNASLIYPDSSTVVLYHLDNNTNYGENQTLANDFGSINLDIVAVGDANPNMTGGKFAGGWVFDGTGDYLSDTGDVGALNGHDNATFSAWIKRAGASSTGFETIVQEAGSTGYYLTASCNDNIIQFGMRVATSTFETTFSNSIIDSNWHQIAGVYDGDSDLVYLYFDGVLKNSSSASTDVANPARGIRVGGHASGTGQGSPCNGISTAAGSFNGTIDEVGVWNRSLTASEILNLYQVSGKYYWKVNLTDSEGDNNESVTMEFTINGGASPNITLNQPANTSVFWIGIFNISLNGTVLDNDNDIKNVRIYGINSNNVSNFTIHGLLFEGKNMLNGTQAVYNWTSPVTLPDFDENALNDEGVVALYHLDNNSAYGENQTLANDFLVNDILGSPEDLFPSGNAYPNMTGGKFAGGWVFDGDGDYLFADPSEAGAPGAANGDDTSTFSAWVKRAGGSSTGYETIVQENAAKNGYSLTASCNDGLIQFVGRESSSESAKAYVSRTLIEDGQWHLVTGVKNTSTILIYVDGTLRNSSSASGVDVADSSGIKVGGHTNAGAVGTSCDNSETLGSFNGTIDEVVIWNRQLSDTEVLNLYRLRKGKYFWKVNITDTAGNSLESETREFVVKDTSYLLVNTNMNCTDLSTETTTYQYGSACSAAGYSTCITLNSDLNISSGANLSVPSSCNIIFNTTSDGGYDFIIENGKLNLTGGNITASNSTNKFDFKPFVNLPTFQGSYGNLSFANFIGSVNISDSRIKMYGLDVENTTIILNSTDIDLSDYSVLSTGRLERQWRLNVSIYSSGSTVSGANVTARNVSLTAISSKLTGSDGAAWFNLSEYYDVGSGKVHQSNYTINATKAGYNPSSGTLNLTSDSSTSISLSIIDLIEVSSTETLHDVYTRINAPSIFNNLSSGSRPCRYVSTASINVTQNGHLILESCTLEMNSTASGQYDLIINGMLTANYSNITRAAAASYDFYTGSDSSITRIILKNSFITRAGSGTTDNVRGLTLNTNNVTFINNTLSHAARSNIDLAANNIVIERSILQGPSGLTFYNIYSRSNNSIILDSNLSNPDNADLFIITGSNLTLLNTNHTTEGGQVNSSLFKQWYADVRVVNGLGEGIDGATVNFYNVSGALTNTATTNSSGDIIRQNVTQYISNGTTRFYWTNYNITAVKAGYINKTINVNITQSANYTIAPPAVPLVTFVSGIGGVDPVEAGVRNINFNFTVQHGDGASNINDSRVRANFTLGTELARVNNSCALISGQNTSSTRNYTCTIGMWYYDLAGTWNLSIYAEDINGNSTTNLTTFTYGTLQAFVMNRNLLNWGTVNINAVNTTFGSALVLNNTGNYNASINITSINLHGETTATEYIGVRNFSVDIDTGGSPPAECDGTLLSNGTQVNIASAILLRGNNTLNYENETSGQEQFYFCLRQIPSGLSQQTYSTSNVGAWTVRIFVVAFAAGGVGDRFRKRKKKELNNQIANALTNVLASKKGQLNYQIDLGELLKGIKVNVDDLLKSVGKAEKEEKELDIPIEIFKSEIGAAEVLCKYLKENKGLKFSEIAKLIGRDQRTIWVNYHNSLRIKERIDERSDSESVPINVFNNRKLSILESLIGHLREKGFRNIEIAEMLQKDPRNVWTIYNRARKKNSERNL